jgi:hypothetical protein
VHGCKVLPSSLETRLSRIFSPEVALAHHICMTCLAYRHLCVAGCQRTVMIEPLMRSESFQLFPRALTRPSLHGILHLVSTSEADIRILRNGHDRLQLRLSFIPLLRRLLLMAIVFRVRTQVWRDLNTNYGLSIICYRGVDSQHF